MLEQHRRRFDIFSFQFPLLFHFCCTLQACVMFSSNDLFPILALTRLYAIKLAAVVHFTGMCFIYLSLSCAWSILLVANATLYAYVIFASPALYDFSLLSVVWAKMKAKVDGQVFNMYIMLWRIRNLYAHTPQHDRCKRKSEKNVQ